MSITIKDIAKIAGVNHSTVSRSLNDSPLVANETKDRIKKIANEYGFEFNASARALSINKTGTIGLIYQDYLEDFNINLFFNTLLNQIKQITEKSGLDIILSHRNNKYTKQNNIYKLVKARKIDGLIIIHSNISNNDLEFINKDKIPCVFLHIKPNNSIHDKVNSFYTDFYHGGYLAAKHFLEMGHRNILCIHANGEDASMKKEGFIAALAENSIVNGEESFICADYSFQSGYRAIMDNIETVKKHSAIFALSDLMALGAIQALQTLNIKVPEDIAVIGYDDIELGTYFSPNLTTIHQPLKEITMLACENLLKQLNDNTAENTIPISKIVKPSIIIRQSCGYNSFIYKK